MTTGKATRRNFLLTALAATGGVIGSAAYLQSESDNASSSASSSESAATVQAANLPKPDATRSMPQRTLGRTGQSIPVLGLGGSASPLSKHHQEQEAIAMIERAFELGVRYFDTAANYGPSEDRLGKVLPAYRAECMIATKTAYRTRDEAWQQLERSLQRLQTDYIDLWQFHSLAYDWDIDTILTPKTGAIAAAEEAKAQGLIRHIGITGHHEPGVIVKGIQRYPFDAALIPINAADRHTPRPFITSVLPVAQKNNTGIIAMKVPAYGRLFKPGVLSGMNEAMGYALSQPGVHCCIIAAATLAQLDENIAVAQQFQQFAAADLQSIENRTAAVWQENSFFRQWS